MHNSNSRTLLSFNRLVFTKLLVLCDKESFLNLRLACKRFHQMSKPLFKCVLHALNKRRCNVIIYGSESGVQRCPYDAKCPVHGYDLVLETFEKWKVDLPKWVWDQKAANKQKTRNLTSPTNAQERVFSREARAIHHRSAIFQ